MAGLGLGLGAGLGSPSAGGGGGAVGPPNPNLLLWSEDLDNASWAKTGCMVVANQGGTTGTADEIISSAGTAAVRQVTSIAASSGSAATATTAFHAGSFGRDSVTGTFDGLPYTFSAESRDSGGGETYTLRLDVVGGFLRVSVEEPVGDGDALFQYFQLEQAAAFTTYHSRGGA
jgi:hypothetical protein